METAWSREDQTDTDATDAPLGGACPCAANGIPPKSVENKAASTHRCWFILFASPAKIATPSRKMGQNRDENIQADL